MNLIESFIALLAPHTCLICGLEGSIICKTCALKQFKKADPICYRCGFIAQNNPCVVCYKASPLHRLWFANNYEGAAKTVVASLKFDRAKAAATVIADLLHKTHPPLPKGTIISPVPTANNRVRKRGYDQAALIARRFAKKRRLKYKEVFRRSGSTRQVGANRQARILQLKGAYSVYKSVQITGKEFLLIDDVLTTGATIESAAHTLRAAGAATVDAAVFAYSKPPSL